MWMVEPARRRRLTVFVAMLLASLPGAGCDGAQQADVPGARDSAAVTDSGSPPDLAAIARELMPRLERLSGLDRVSTLRLRTQDREAARQYVIQRLDSEMPPAEREGIRRVYAALGLIPDTLDLDGLLTDLYTEQVLGYYDPDTKTMWVIEGADPEAVRSVLAHELVHALQDQHTDLDGIIDRGLGNDRQTAAHAAMEGHAMLVMFAVIAEEATGRPVDPARLPDPSEQLAAALTAQNEQYPVFQRAPRVIRETLLFPYLGGAGFVHALWRDRAPQPRYPAPIDSLLPLSTEQVLRPRDRFLNGRDEPVELRWSSAPAGWTVVRENNLGQLEMEILLEHYGGRAARSAAAGWDGDRYVLLEHESGAEALLWESVWDTPADADRFARAVSGALPRATVQRTAMGTQAAVRVILAPAGRVPEGMSVTAAAS